MKRIPIEFIAWLSVVIGWALILFVLKADDALKVILALAWIALWGFITRR